MLKSVLKLATMLALMATGTSVANADEGRDYALKSTIALYFGGIKVATFDVLSLVQGQTYQSTAHIQPTSFVRFFLDAESKAKAQGQTDGILSVPARFEGETRGIGDERDVILNYDPDGTVHIEHLTPALENEQRIADRHRLMQNTVDPLTAALFTPTFVKDGKVCQHTTAIFDGSMRFDLGFSPVGPEQLAPRNDTYYTGPTMVCNVKVDIHDIFNDEARADTQNINTDKPAKVWIAALPAPDGGADVMVPAKVQVQTGMGAIMAHLIEYELVRASDYQPERVAAD